MVHWILHFSFTILLKHMLNLKGRFNCWKKCRCPSKKCCERSADLKSTHICQESTMTLQEFGNRWFLPFPFNHRRSKETRCKNPKPLHKRLKEGLFSLLAYYQIPFTRLWLEAERSNNPSFVTKFFRSPKERKKLILFSFLLRPNASL